MNPSIQLKCALIERLPCGVIQSKYKDNYLINLLDANEIDLASVDLALEEDMYCVVIATSGPKLLSDEALDFFASKSVSSKRMKGLAIVLKDLPNRLLSQVFIRIHNPIYPTKMFNKEENAMAWLKQLKINNREKC